MNASAEQLAQLLAENADLRARLQEAEDTLSAIHGGEVDALVVGNDIYTLDSANAASNALRKDVLSQMEDAVLAFDQDDHVIFMNPAAERQYGVSASAALGCKRSAVYREDWASPADEAAAQQALRDGGTYRAQSVHRPASGLALQVESSVSTLRNADGLATGRLAVIRDVSLRVQAEHTLREATVALTRRERQFASLVENSPDVIARFDRALRQVYLSPVAERYTGVPAAQHLGKTHAQAGLPPELCRQWDDAIERAFATAQIGRLKFVATTVHGDEKHFDARVIPEFADDGSVESVLSISSDVTEQEAVNAALVDSQTQLQITLQALRDADRRKDEFLATLAHELRNPLAPIRNALGVMGLSADPAVHRQARTVIERQLRQMVHLVDDLMDVSRISQGKVELRREVTDLAGIVQTAIETSRPLIDAGRHTLTLRLPPPQSLLVDADVTRLTQIIANLLNNAAKYTPEGGRIEVTAGRHDGQAVITVQDSGMGIPPEMLPRVFDMFAQVDRTLARAQGGLGIGLALVKRLAELHGGTVQAFSAGQGAGCRFVVRLPVSAPPAGDATAASALSPAADAGAGVRVLVVDDNVDSAETLAELLQMVGYETRTAHDGVDAVHAARAFEPAVVLLDIGLPRMNGHDAARAMRRDAGGRPMLLVALSGWGQDTDRHKSQDAGFDHHLVKPVDIDTLTALLAAHRPR